MLGLQEATVVNLQAHVQQLEQKFGHVRSDYEALQGHFDEAQQQIVEQTEAHESRREHALVLWCCRLPLQHGHGTSPAHSLHLQIHVQICINLHTHTHTHTHTHMPECTLACLHACTCT